MFKKSKSSFKRFDKPTFYLRLDTSECKYDVKINGTFVEYNYGGRPHHIDYPINHWLRSGHNEIVIRMYEWPDDEAGYGVGTRKAPAKFSGRIKVKNSGEDISTASEICNVIYQDVLEPEKTGIGNSSEPGTFTLKESIEASAKGDIEISEIEKDVMESPRGIQVSRTFNLPVDLPEWGFFHGDDIPSLAEMTDEEFDKITAELFAETMKLSLIHI